MDRGNLGAKIEGAIYYISKAIWTENIYNVHCVACVLLFLFFNASATNRGVVVLLMMLGVISTPTLTYDVSSTA
jgi:hypothetical protein